MVLTIVGIATTLFKGALHDTSSVLSCLVTLNVAGYSDNWLYAVAIMGCAGLLPLYIFTIVVPDGDPERNEKIRLRMAHLCTAGALLSVVVNLATFNKP